MFLLVRVFYYDQIMWLFFFFWIRFKHVSGSCRKERLKRKSLPNNFIKN